MTEGSLSVKEIARLDGVSTDAVRRSIRRGELRAEKVHGRVRVRLSDYEAFKVAHRVVVERPVVAVVEVRPRGSGRAGLAELRRIRDEEENAA